MAGIARLLEKLHVTVRFVETTEGAAPAGFAQPHRQAKADDADRMRACEVRRIRQNPASLIAPRY
ncbi:hypothetical protein ACKI2N_030085 [Cupriavidus sp. 30B13]|uniref:hypothetical protein n=1 Tax=Cupriavidus sp. 30B13 TaxID=3384241 RepID=UPI003B8F8A56